MQCGNRSTAWRLLKTTVRGTATQFGPQFQVALVSLLCLFMGSTFHRSNSALKRSSSRTLPLRPAEVQFVIADLDGDRKPDLALVELGSQRSAKTNYSIRFRFSAGAESAIGVSAPFGGLRVAARDVNGDDNIDLIVTSNLDESFIEVLLNDGHGNFSVAAPGTYAELENESPVLLNGPAGPLADRTTLASLRSSFGEAHALVYDNHTVPSWDCFSFTKDQTTARQVLHSRLGRSPPLPVAL